MLARGTCNKLIARELDLSVHTVKRHVARVMMKLRVGTRAQAASHYRVAKQVTCESEGPAARELTARERDVLERVARGASNLQIAADLALSLNTVKRHAANIREKLGVHSRVHAAALLYAA